MADDRWDSARYAREKRRFVESRLLHRWVGVHSGVIFGITWASGWLVSALLLRLGMASMPLRYAIGFALSYPVFFLCVRIWADFMQQERGSSQDMGSGMDFPAGDGEGCLVILVAMVLGMVLAVVFAWLGGPALMLEVAFEVVSAGVLVQRLGRVDIVGNWAGVLLRKTLPFAAAVLFGLIVVAGLLQENAPGVRTFAEAVRSIWASSTPMKAR